MVWCSGISRHYFSIFIFLSFPLFSSLSISYSLPPTLYLLMYFSNSHTHILSLTHSFFLSLSLILSLSHSRSQSSPGSNGKDKNKKSFWGPITKVVKKEKDGVVGSRLEYYLHYNPFFFSVLSYWIASTHLSSCPIHFMLKYFLIIFPHSYFFLSFLF